MKINHFAGALAAQMPSTLIEGQFIPANRPESMTISGYIRDGRIYGESFPNRLGGILQANTAVSVAVVGELEYYNLLDICDGTYHHEIPAVLIGWKVELNGNGYSEWLTKTPVYQVEQLLHETRVAVEIAPGIARWGTKEINQHAKVLATVDLGLNPKVTRNDNIVFKPTPPVP